MKHALIALCAIAALASATFGGPPVPIPPGPPQGPPPGWDPRLGPPPGMGPAFRPGPPGPPVTPVAVFNFQLTTADKTPEWVWLEKFLADQITTDFHASRAVPVIARDWMQVVAEQVKWAPEMATQNAGSVDRIRASLRIAHLVSGVCSVKDGRVEIVGQIVELATRKELFRAKVEGPTADALSLQKKLSSELLGWFLKKPAATILPTMPVWTRSLPAARALYVGMDLYDQGRYAEAWLSFRQSARTDQSYAEAAYWVGKMYYFMDRYEHARVAFDRFVYMDERHPRVPDCVREYLHTYEKLDAAPELLLRLYREFQKRLARYPDAEFLPPWSPWRGTWLVMREAQMLEELHRHGEAVARLGPAFSPDGMPGGPNPFERENPLDPQGWAMIQDKVLLKLANLVLHYARGGAPLDRDRVVVSYPGVQSTWQQDNFYLSFADGQAEKITRPQNGEVRMSGKDLRLTDIKAVTYRPSIAFQFPLMGRWTAMLTAPAGRVFKRLRLYPVAEGDQAVLEVQFFEPDSMWRRIGPVRSCGFAEARAGKFSIDDPPIGAIIRAAFNARVKDANTSPMVAFNGIRVVPEFEAPGPTGTLDIACQATGCFAVDVDGRYGRRYPGLVGPLPVGTHTVKFRPLDDQSPYEPWTTTAVVREGQATRVPGQLGWKKGSPWESWQAALVGGDYPGRQIDVGAYSGMSPLLMDGGSVRLVWAARNGLWTSLSTDGQTFCPPARLPLPVSTAWHEGDPRCFLDESGRYVLTFYSDRDAQHRSLLYICWSRDFEHWTAPRKIMDPPSYQHGYYSIFQDTRGRYVMLMPTGPGQTTVLLSSDGVRWEQRNGPSLNLPGNPAFIRDVAIFQRPDGRYGAYLLLLGNMPGKDGEVAQAVSDDLASWQVDPKAIKFSEACFRMSRVWDGRQEMLVLFRMADLQRDRDGLSVGIAVLRRDESGAWQKQVLPGVGDQGGVVGVHPKWGLFMASMGQGGIEGSPRRPAGPYMLHGPQLQALPASAQTRPVTEPPAQPAPPPPPQPKPLGELVSVYSRYESNEVAASFPRVVQGAEQFKPVATGKGIVWNGAKVVTLPCGGIQTLLALDADDPRSLHPDRLRWDLTGTGDFRNAVVLRAMQVDPAGKGAFVHLFRTFGLFPNGLQVRLGKRQMGIDMEVCYRSGPAPRLTMTLHACLEGPCKLGQKTYRVRVRDCTNDLTFTDVAKPTPGYTSPIMRGDMIRVDLGSGQWNQAIEGYYGHPIWLDNKLWNIRLAADGNSLSGEPWPAPLGQVRFDHPNWECTLLSDRLVVSLSGGKDPVPLPPGKYQISRFTQTGQSEERPSKVMVLHQVGLKPLPVVVEADKACDVDAGSPFTFRVTANRSGEGYRFAAPVFDRAGRGAFLVDDGMRQGANPPIFEVLDAAGKSVAKVAAPTIMLSANWPIPAGLKGKFTVTLHYRMPGLETKTQDATFTIE